MNVIMKNLFLSLIALFSLLKGVSGQSNVKSEEVLIGEVQPINELNYFFFFGNQLKDIRNFSTVLENVTSGELKELSGGDFVICSQASYRSNVFTVIDKNNKIINQFTVSGYLSPNWNYLIKLKNGDLWREDIDFNTGGTLNARQITQLGLFEKKFTYGNWYGDFVFFQPYWDKPDMYLLNTSNGKFEKSSVPAFIDTYSGSPTGRFFRTETTYGSKIYDFEKKKFVLALDDIDTYDVSIKQYSSSYMWLSETVLLVRMCYNSSKYDKDISVRIYDLENPESHKELILHTYPLDEYGQSIKFEGSCTNRYKTDLYSKFKKLRLAPSNDSNHLLYGGKDLFWYDLTTGKSSKWTNDCTKTTFKEYAEYLVHDWVTRDELIYPIRGNLMEQGTWVLNCKTGKKSKITPFMAERFWSFENIGYVMFEANNNLYSYNNDKGLKVLQENFSRYKKIKVLKSRY